jgi:hypothetical protein
MSTQSQDDERARRIGINEGVFRNMNEQLKGLAEKFELDDQLFLVCECGYPECDKRLRIPAAEYEQIRADARLFALVPGHELGDVEKVVSEHKGYNVVKKDEGTPAQVARATDPRSE